MLWHRFSDWFGEGEFCELGSLTSKIQVSAVLSL